MERKPSACPLSPDFHASHQHRMSRTEATRGMEARGAPVPPSTGAAAETDLLALFSSEGTESVAAAALRDFCSAPATQKRATSSMAGSESSVQTASKEGQPRRSASRRQMSTETTSPDTRNSRSHTPTSSNSSDPGRSEEVTELSDASSTERSSDTSRSPPPRRHKQMRGEGERTSPADSTYVSNNRSDWTPSSATSVSSSVKSTSAHSGRTGGADFSASSSEAQARLAFVDQRRSDEARVPPRKPVAPRAARYNTFGETDRSARAVGAHSISMGTPALSALEHARAVVSMSGDLASWLSAQGFEASIHSRLVATGAHSMSHAARITKSNLKQLLGVGNGIRLHLALRDVEAARATLIAAGESVPDTEADAPRGRGRLSAASCLPSHTTGRSHSPSTLFRELHPPGLHGYCALSDCELPANVTCASRTCQIGLCTFHAHKLLLTGASMCEDCYTNASVLEELKEVSGINALQEQGYIQPVDQCVLQ